MIKSEIIEKVVIGRLREFYEVGPVQRAAVEDFADALYHDIIRVVAAQALSNESAFDVFSNLSRIYEGKNLRPLTEQMSLKYGDETDWDF